MAKPSPSPCRRQTTRTCAAPAGTEPRSEVSSSRAPPTPQAWCGDRDGKRELTAEAAALARELGDTTRLTHHGGFSPLTVQLHRISAETPAGDPLAALDAARTIPLKALPSVERRSRALGDIAGAYHRLGRRSDGFRTLLAAERLAPEGSGVERDLHHPRAALRWSQQAEPMPVAVHTRAVGLRAAVTVTIHAENRYPDRALEAAERSLTVLSRARSARGHDYLRSINTALSPWESEPAVTGYLHRARTALART
ncbi:hypothetical protein ABZX40_26840 [Streptomyces sp. NPDC004610]|uniref:hypothetical protein n=1 Tax=unclassified Streptomyces TaxID=2593676 RepID=UPI0033A07021